jgi:trimethylamine--corrinoid protein Co-methyltransferase
MPDLADRDLRETWAENGSADIHKRALNKAMAILSRPNRAVLDAETDARIKAHFAGIVAGESTLPAGWAPFEIGSRGAGRERRQTRRRMQLSV